MVVGGGLSAAQLALHALRLGWRSVCLVCRGPICVRPFDLSEEWMGRHFVPALKPCEAAFFGAPAEERRALLRRARPGGSWTPRAVREVGEMQHRGGLTLRPSTKVLAVEWRDGGGGSDDGGEWCVQLGDEGGGCVPGSFPGDEGGAERCAETRGLLDSAPASLGAGPACARVRADAIWLATGHRLEASGVGALRTLRSRHASSRALPEHGGLPQLTPTLRWDEDTPLWLAGALAALQIGPDALNLAGAGVSAARIVPDLLGQA